MKEKIERVSMLDIRCPHPTNFYNLILINQKQEDKFMEYKECRKFLEYCGGILFIDGTILFTLAFIVNIALGIVLGIIGVSHFLFGFYLLSKTS